MSEESDNESEVVLPGSSSSVSRIGPLIDAVCDREHNAVMSTIDEVEGSDTELQAPRTVEKRRTCM